MTDRKVPALMRPHATTAVQTKATVETARVENTDPNSCPICGNTLVLRTTSGLSVKACLSHNIVMPVQD